MKFKEIKPGMVIHCPKEEDARALLEHLEELRYTWLSGIQLSQQFRYSPDGLGMCYQIEDEHVITSASRLKMYELGKNVTEFSDLLEPESNLANDLTNNLDNQMSAVEVLGWFAEADWHIIAEVFEGWRDVDDVIDQFTAKDIINKITAYEAARKAPKPVELEWVDLMRVYEVKENGEEIFVGKTEIPADDWYPTAEGFFKKCVTENPGKRLIAYADATCRVKGE